MLALQIQGVILAFVWFALAAVNNGGIAILWATVGAIIFAIVHVIAAYLLDGVLEASLTGVVASNGIYLISRLVAILIGFVVCFLALQAWTRRATPPSLA